MGFEFIIGSIIAAIAGIFGAYNVGSYKAKSKADTDNRIANNNIETKRVLDANQKSTEKQLAASSNATKVQHEINSLNDGDALRELRDNYSRD